MLIQDEEKSGYYMVIGHDSTNPAYKYKTGIYYATSKYDAKSKFQAETGWFNWTALFVFFQYQ